MSSLSWTPQVDFKVTDRWVMWAAVVAVRRRWRWRWMNLERKFWVTGWLLCCPDGAGVFLP